MGFHLGFLISISPADIVNLFQTLVLTAELMI